MQTVNDRIRKVKKRPLECEAMIFGAYTEAHGPAPWNDGIAGIVWRWLTQHNVVFRLTQGSNGPAFIILRTPEGNKEVHVGSFLVKEPDGVIRTYTNEEFHEQFEEVGDDN